MRGRGGGIGIGACGGAGGAAPGRAWPAHAPLAGIAMELVSRSLFLNPSGFPLPLPLPPFPASSIGGEAARSCVHTPSRPAAHQLLEDIPPRQGVVWTTLTGVAAE